MSIWGKLIGGAAGFAIGGPIGALIGAVSGHVVDKYRQDTQALPGPSRQAAFALGTIVLAAKLAKADGVVTRDEIATFKRIFHIPSVEMAEVGRIFNEARRTATGFEPYAEQIAHMFGRGSAVLGELLEALYLVAAADGVVHPAEQAYLRTVADIFGLDDADLDRIASRHRPSGTSDPYAVLGVDRSIGDADLKAHHRTLVREHHPDKLIAQGTPEEFVALANEKLAAINAAYDEIRSQRGLS